MRKVISSIVCVGVFVISVVSCKATVETQVLKGIVFDATMNNIILITANADTVDVSTMNANPQKVPGVLLNDSVQVVCVEKDVDGKKILTATELKILVHSPYYYIQGTWLEPNPIDPKGVQGFTLKQDGTAASVNMATLLFKSWNLDNRTLTLNYESIGNGQTIAGIDTLQVSSINADSLILSDDNGIVWQLGRKK